MAVNVKPTEPQKGRPPLRVLVGGRSRRAFDLHLVSYVVGNAVFWTLWAAVTVEAEPWFWWPLVPSAAWTIVVLLHALLLRRGQR